MQDQLVSAWLRSNLHMRKEKKKEKKRKLRLAPQILPWQHSQPHCTNWFMGTDASAFPVVCSHHHSSPRARAVVCTANQRREFFQRACWSFVLAHKATLTSWHESLSEKTPLLSQAASPVSKSTERASSDKTNLQDLERGKRSQTQ